MAIQTKFRLTDSGEGGLPMRKLVWLSSLWWMAPVFPAEAAAPIVVVTDAEGASARVGAPVSLEMDADALPAGGNTDCGLHLIEITAGHEDSKPLAAQFVADDQRPDQGRLWWLMPPGEKGERRFRLVAGQKSVAVSMVAQHDPERQAVQVTDGTSPVLRYNHGTVPPPPEIVQRYEKEMEPPQHYARGHYIHPVFGPDGEQISDDYSLDHPHHRGISWAWPHVHYQGESRDIWAVRVLPTQPGGAWARPVAMHRVVSGPVLALIDAECDWRWGDTTPIVRDRVVIRAFRQTDGCRFLDIDIFLVALQDGVAIAGQGQAAYGGFNLRTFPAFDQRNIDMRIDPPGAEPRRAWYHLTGIFPGGKRPAGVAMLEHVGNPDYPNWPDLQDHPDLVPGGYPRWRSVQPAWPGNRKVALPKGEPLVLKYRLWIHPDVSDEAPLADVWQAYAEPARASLAE